MSKNKDFYNKTHKHNKTRIHAKITTFQPV